MKTQIYQPLPNPLRSIRLLSISPGWPSDPISVALVTIQDIEDAPAYDALSYVWGTAHDPNPVSCNGIPKQVTKSLSSALRALRPLPSADPEKAHQNGVRVMAEGNVLHSSHHLWRGLSVNKWEKPLHIHAESSFIWVDALCINQDDLEERANQVKTMRRIYAEADTVYIWFGTELDCTTDDAHQPLVPPSLLDRLLGRVRLTEYANIPVVLGFLSQAYHNSNGTTYF